MLRSFKHGGPLSRWYIIRGKLALIVHQLEKSKNWHSPSLSQTHKASQRITLLRLCYHIKLFLSGGYSWFKFLLYTLMNFQMSYNEQVYILWSGKRTSLQKQAHFFRCKALCSIMTDRASCLTCFWKSSGTGTRNFPQKAVGPGAADQCSKVLLVPPLDLSLPIIFVISHKSKSSPLLANPKLSADCLLTYLSCGIRIYSLTKAQQNKKYTDGFKCDPLIANSLLTIPLAYLPLFSLKLWTSDTFKWA